MSVDQAQILPALADAKIDFILIGGMAVVDDINIEGDTRRAVNVPTLLNGLNFTLTTKLGDLDLLGEVVGGGSYRDLLPHTLDVEAFGVRFKCIDLPTLIKLKRAAGRPKDLESLAELQALLEERKR